MAKSIIDIPLNIHTRNLAKLYASNEGATFKYYRPSFTL